MRKSLLALLVVLLSTSSLVQAAVQLRDGHPDSYTVVRGDTLWDISGRFLSKPWQWRDLWQNNRQVKNPDLIYPGDTLYLGYANGEPYLSLQQGSSRGTVKLSPQIRTKPVVEAIPSIPLGKIQAFLVQNRIVNSAEQFEKAPYVIASNNDRIISGLGDRIFARGKFQEVGTAYGVFRQGKRYRDPDTGESLGINADSVGNANLSDVQGDIATLKLTGTTEEVRPGDRLFGSEVRPISTFFQPSEPQKTVKGVILGVPKGVSQVGKLDVVILSRGTHDGLEEGNVLAIYKTGERVRDPISGDRVKVPDERAGLLMVFRAYDRMSYGLVLSADRPLKLYDQVRNP